MTVDSWSHCSSCKGDIGFGETYYVCSVSTCQRKGSDFRFCSVECWDMHVPTMRHREAWAEENRSPTRAAREREHPPAPRPTVSASPPPPASAPRAAAPAGAIEREILVVVSKMKAYVRARSGMNTSDAFADVLSDWIRAHCDEAIRSAEREGRRTVLDRDLRRPI
jgi:hypothetical protein